MTILPETIKKIFTKRTIVIIALALFTYVLTHFANRFPSLTESWYSGGIYPFIAQLLTWLSGTLPFSLDDLFYLLLILWFISLLAFSLFKKISWAKSISWLIQTLAIVYIGFYWLWGFNYFREDLNKRLALEPAKPDAKELINTFSWLIDQTNTTYVRIDSVDKNRTFHLLEEEYKRQEHFLRIQNRPDLTRPKNISLSRFFAAATIGGYYGPFFSEVHVNPYLLPLEYPAVLAHEMAHFYGITSEAEANFYAWYVCSNSNNLQLQYSANLHLLRYFVYECYKLEGFEEAVSNILPGVRFDYRRIQQHWRSLMNEDVEDVASAVNDAYLKSNKIEEGIDDYDGVVKFVMDYRITTQE